MAAYNQTRYSHCDVLLILSAEAAMQHKKTVGLRRIKYSIRLEHDLKNACAYRWCAVVSITEGGGSFLFERHRAIDLILVALTPVI